MNEGSLGVHEVKFVVQSGPSFRDGGGITQHTNSTWNFSQISPRNRRRRLIVDSNLRKYIQLIIHLPVNEGSLGVHEIELVVQSGPGLCDGSGIAQHANSTRNFSQIPSRDHGRRLIVYSNLGKCMHSGAPTVLLSFLYWQ